MNKLLSQIEIHFVVQEFNVITIIVFIKTRPFKIRRTVYVLCLCIELIFSH